MELRWFTAFPPESYDCGVSLRPRPPRGEIAHGPLRLLHVLPGPLQVYPAAAPTDGWCLCSSGLFFGHTLVGNVVRPILVRLGVGG